MSESTFEYKGVKLIYLKHAAFQIKNGGVVIYIDPFQLPPADLEKADIVLVTHDHPDHFDMSSIQNVATKDTVIVCPKSCNVERYEVINVTEGDKVEVKGVKIEAVPAYNINKEFHPRGMGVGYVIEISGVKIYHTGDTDRIPEMKEIEVDIALLPIGGTYTMDVNEAIEAAKDIKAKYYIPMHYGVIPGTDANVSDFRVENAVILKPLLM